MSTYRAPLADMQFVLNELAGLDQVASLPGFEDATPDTVTAILEEASKFATEVLDPLNATGDREGSKLLPDGTVEDARRVQGRLPAIRRERLERAHEADRSTAARTCRSSSRRRSRRCGTRRTWRSTCARC